MAAAPPTNPAYAALWSMDSSRHDHDDRSRPVNSVCKLCTQSLDQGGKPMVLLPCGHAYHVACGPVYVAAIASPTTGTTTSKACPHEHCAGTEDARTGAEDRARLAEQTEARRESETRDYRDPILVHFQKQEALSRERRERTRAAQPTFGRNAGSAAGTGAGAGAGGGDSSQDDDSDTDDHDAYHSEAAYRKRWEAKRGTDGLPYTIKLRLLQPYGKARAVLDARSTDVTMQVMFDKEAEFVRQRTAAKRPPKESATTTSAGEDDESSGDCADDEGPPVDADDMNTRISIDRFLRTGLDLSDIYFGLGVSAFGTLMDIGLKADHVTNNGGAIPLVALHDLYRVGHDDLSDRLMWDARDVATAKITARELHHVGVTFDAMSLKLGLTRKRFVGLRYSPEDWVSLGLSKYYLVSALHINASSLKRMSWDVDQTIRAFDLKEADIKAIGIAIRGKDRVVARRRRSEDSLSSEDTLSDSSSDGVIARKPRRWARKKPKKSHSSKKSKRSRRRTRKASTTAAAPPPSTSSSSSNSSSSSSDSDSDSGSKSGSSSSSSSNSSSGGDAYYSQRNHRNREHRRRRAAKMEAKFDAHLRDTFRAARP